MSKLSDYAEKMTGAFSLDDEKTPTEPSPRISLGKKDMTLAKRWDRHMRRERTGQSGLLREYGQPVIGLGSPSNTVDVSVIIPVYNMESYLRQAVESVLQSGRHMGMEVICVNDGSTDRSCDIIADLMRADRRVSVINKENGGYGAAVNRGLRAAQGTYVAIMEPDDWVLPGMYDSLLGLAEASGSRSGRLPDIVKSSYWRVLDSGTDSERMLHCSYYKRVEDRIEPFRIQDAPQLVMHHPSIWSAVYRREFLAEKGIRMREVPGAGWVDNPWLYETMCQADSIIYTNDAWYCYREDLAGSSSSGDVMLLSIERWNDMMDILEGIGMTDEGVLSSLHVIGFRYIQDILKHDGMANPVVASRVDRMLRRMDLSIVAGLANVSPRLLAMAYEAQEASVPDFPPMRYNIMLAKEFGKTIQTDGIGVAIEKARKKLGL